MRYLLALFLVLVFGVTGCKKADEKSPDEAKQAAEGAVQAANAAVPADLSGKLKFTIFTEPKKERYQAVVPERWKQSKFIPGSFEPEENAGMGFGTRFSVGSNCDGLCEPKDWAAVAEKVDFKQFKMGSPEIVKDEQVPGGGRLVIAKQGDRVLLQMAIWREKSSHYFTCRARLGKEIAAAAPAFEAACRGLQVMEW